MEKFEFIFSLFGLVMGLALTELLGGFAKAVKRHGPARLGTLTPVITAFLVYEITDFWMNAWSVRDAMPIGMPTLLVCVVITGFYYFATVLVWPEDGDPGWNDLDGWMLAHKKQLLLSVFASNAVTGVALAAIGAPETQASPAVVVWMAAYFGLILTGAFARGRHVTLIVVGLLLAMHLTALAVDVLG